MGIIDLLPDHLRIEHPIEEFDIDIEENELKAYIAGLFDGEGLVGADLSKAESNRIGWSVYPYLKIDQSYSDGSPYSSNSVTKGGDVIINNARVGIDPMTDDINEDNLFNSLENVMSLLIESRIRKYCDIVDCSISRVTEIKKEENHMDVNRFVIRGIDGVEAFLNGVYPYLTEKRLQAMIMLGEILPRMKEGKHLHVEGYIEIVEYVDKMNSMKGGVRGEYNAEYFREEEFKEELDMRTSFEDFS